MKRQLTLFPPRRPLLERFGVEFFRQVPERPGVYLMCGAGAGVLYVGKAKNLRRRLASYRSADLDRIPRRLRRLLCAVERIVWDECADESAALERESELLQAMSPRFNTVGVRPAKPDYIGWRLADGVFSVGLGESTVDWPERHGPDVRSRRLYRPLLRSLWWVLHPEQGWDRMPAQLWKAKFPTTWSIPINEEAEAARRRLAQFFRGQSPELAEWCVWSAARRPLFERTWAGSDALALLEFYERLIETEDSPDQAAEPVCFDSENSSDPVSPACSRAEKEPAGPHFKDSNAPGLSLRRDTFLPLPGEEGRGEGKGSDQHSAGADPSQAFKRFS